MSAFHKAGQGGEGQSSSYLLISCVIPRVVLLTIMQPFLYTYLTTHSQEISDSYTQPKPIQVQNTYVNHRLGKTLGS